MNRKEYDSERKLISQSNMSQSDKNRLLSTIEEEWQKSQKRQKVIRELQQESP